MVQTSASDQAEGGASGGRPVVVLDTCVLVTDADALFAFPDHDVVVPLPVVEELDGLKTRSDDRGRAARRALRNIEEARTGGGDLRTGAPLPGGGRLRVVTDVDGQPELASHGLDPSRNDNRVLAAALSVAQDAGPVTLVTNDLAVRVKASGCGLADAAYTPAPVREPVAADGWATVDVPSALVDTIHSDGFVATDASADLPGLPVNTFLVLRSPTGGSALARRVNGHVQRLPSNDPRVWGVSPRSAEQRFALEALLDPDIKVVAIVGPAGTGKTLLALAAGLQQTVNDRTYGHVGVFRPVVPVGRGMDLGHLPGTLEEKLSPWTVAVTDQLAALQPGTPRKQVERERDRLVEQGLLEFGSIAHVRGRSITNAFLLLDEMQNTEIGTAKTLLSRVGEGTKVVLTGDPSQVDSPWLSRSNNGLAAVVSAFTGQDCFAHVRLHRTERSEVAALTAELL